MNNVGIIEPLVVWPIAARTPAAENMLPKAKTPDALLRMVALTILIGDISHNWTVPREFPPCAKRGVDIAAILKPEVEIHAKSNGKEEPSMATKPKKGKTKKKKPASKKKDAAQQTA